jgi:leucyl-tRNA synthetase
MGRPYSIHNQTWPKWDETLAKEDEITLVVQVNGKVRDRITLPASVTEAEAREKALGSDKVKAHLEGKNIANVVYVPGRLINVVVK